LVKKRGRLIIATWLLRGNKYDTGFLKETSVEKKEKGGFVESLVEGAEKTG